MAIPMTGSMKWLDVMEDSGLRGADYEVWNHKLLYLVL